jgi:hypothetical protein
MDQYFAFKRTPQKKRKMKCADYRNGEGKFNNRKVVERRLADLAAMPSDLNANSCGTD